MSSKEQTSTAESVKFWQSLKSVIKCTYLPMSKLSAKSATMDGGLKI